MHECQRMIPRVLDASSSAFCLGGSPCESCCFFLLVKEECSLGAGRCGETPPPSPRVYSMVQVIKEVKESHREETTVKGYTKEGVAEPVTVADASSNKVRSQLPSSLRSVAVEDAMSLGVPLPPSAPFPCLLKTSCGSWLRVFDVGGGLQAPLGPQPVCSFCPI